ncbi:hypothetical protein [Neorhizobium sp. JUb45]|uniref:hypothetical protein n=1 Tax=unclassified Neorhizobium TaxID=2629175 RepID=UPI00104D40F0|nr:hypothetical protein [Neorhizobium sp. JUb45]TCR07203.1 hypothetical protein EDF70_1011173 [Neorhizobium sp. JUb45]
MDDSQRVTVDISADLMAAVKEAVDAGLYTSADEIINDALAVWHESQTQNMLWAPPGTECSAEEHDRWFRAEVQKTLAGLADGTVGIVDDDEHKKRRDQRLAIIRARAAG